MRTKAGPTKVKVTQGAQQFRTLDLLSGPVKINEMVVDAFTRRKIPSKKRKVQQKSVNTSLKQNKSNKNKPLSPKYMEKKNIPENSPKKSMPSSPKNIVKRSVNENNPKKNMPLSPKKVEKKSIHENSPKKNIPSSPKNAEKKNSHENSPIKNIPLSPKNAENNSDFIMKRQRLHQQLDSLTSYKQETTI